MNEINKFRDLTATVEMASYHQDFSPQYGKKHFNPLSKSKQHTEKLPRQISLANI